MADSDRGKETSQKRSEREDMRDPQSLSDTPLHLSVQRSNLPLLIQRAQQDPQTLTAQDVMVLQRTIGNRATGTLLQPLLAKQKEPTAIENAPLNSPGNVQRTSWIQRETGKNDSDGTSTKKPLVNWKSGKTGGERAPMQNPTFKIGSKSKWTHKEDKKDTKEQEIESLEELHEMEETTEEIGTLGELDEREGATEERETLVEPQKKEYREGSLWAKFQRRYDSLMKNSYPHLHLDVTGRLNEFKVLCNGLEVEDYTEQVLTNQHINKLLTPMNEMVKAGSKEAQQKCPNLVADLLLAASLIPVQVTDSGHIKFHHKERVYKRLSARVVSIRRLIDVLFDVNQQLAQHEDIGEGEALKYIDLNQDQSLAKRMLNLSMVNLHETARKHLAGNPLFEEMLKSEDVFKIMMASGGAVEQQFLNSCMTTAVTQEVQENVSNLASLLIVGRGVADFIERGANDEDLEDQVKQWHKIGVTVKSAALKRVKDARKEFAEIEKLALPILQKKPINMGKIQALIRRWSRTMQKLSAMTDLSEGKRNVPVLTKRLVDNHWNVSATASTLSLYVFGRAKRRFGGMTGESYRDALSETTKMSVPTNSAQKNLNPWLGTEKVERLQKLDVLWGKVLDAGGTTFSIPGHGLYLQAIKRGDQKIFMVGDPLIDEHEFYTLEEMHAYANKVKKKEMMVPVEILTTTVPARFTQQALMYRKVDDLGKNEKEATLAPYTVSPKIKITNVDDRDPIRGEDGNPYLNVTVDGEGIKDKHPGMSIVGWVAKKAVFY